MKKNDIVVFGKWLGDSYGESFAIVRDINSASIDVRYALNDQVLYATGVQLALVAEEGEDYYREAFPIDFTDQSPVSGQVVWVSRAREEEDSKIYQGLVLSCPVKFGEGGDIDHSLRVIFGRRTRTLFPQSMAMPCDSFWSVEQPAPVYCDDD